MNYTREMTRDELMAKMAELEKALDETKATIEHLRHENDKLVAHGEMKYRDGVIYGLRYAIRCNGVSGGEVS